MIDQELNPQAPALTIRPATSQDALLLTELGARTFYEAYTHSLPAGQLAEFIPTIFSPELQAAELADPATSFFVAEIDGTAVGYVTLQDESVADANPGARNLKLARIYLSQDWTGRGIGSALMEASLAEAARLGFDTISLEVWERNERARAFYRKWGFVEAGSVTFRFGNEIQTDLVFRRSLADLAS